MTIRRVVRQGVCASGAALLAAATAASAQDVTWSASFGYATGSYIFEEPFRSFSLLNSLTLRAGRLSLSASLPVVARNGTAISYVAGVPVPTGGPDNAVVRRRQQGETIPVRGGRGRGQMGGSLAVSAAADTVADSISVAGTGSYEVNVADPIFGGSVTAYESLGLVRSFDLEAWAKAPLASEESGVGTGAWDYGAGASLALGLGEALLFVNATWWTLGDMSDLELEDALFYSVAVGRPIGGAWSLLASAAASTRIVAGSDPPGSVNLLLSRRIGQRSSLSVGLGAGITESASAFTASLGWSTSLRPGDR